MSTQVQGVDPISGITYYYRLNSSNIIESRYDSVSKTWVPGVYARPNSFTSMVSQAESEAAISSMVNDKTFKRKSGYLLAGDEPDSSAPFVVDIKSRMSESDVTTIKSLFQKMPRQYLWAWFKKEILPSLPGPVTVMPNEKNYYGEPLEKKPTQDLIWAAFIDLFNEANLEYVTAQKLSPWDWEEEKGRAYIVSESKAGLAELSAKFDAYRTEILGTDPVAQGLIEEYNKLPKIGDPGLEISRQYSVAELLKKKEYKIVKGIIDGYKFAQGTVLDVAVTQPIPYDLVSNDGKIVKATPSN